MSFFLPDIDILITFEAGILSIMKRRLLFLSLLTGFIFVSCKKDNERGLDPNAKISVTGVHSQSKADVADVPAGGIAGTGITDSLEFVTKYAFDFQMKRLHPNGELVYPSRAFGFRDDDYYLLRDLKNNKLKFWGSDVIVAEGSMLGETITTDVDIVVTAAKWPDGTAAMPLGFDIMQSKNVTIDTVAYIPNSVVLEARAKITAAFDAGDYDACYKLFDEAYVFLPTTGPKWRAMKEAGIE